MFCCAESWHYERGVDTTSKEHPSKSPHADFIAGRMKYIAVSAVFSGVLRMINAVRD